MAVRIGDTAPDFTAETTEGTDPLPRVAGRQLGDPLLPPQGLHAGLHDRARCLLQGQAGVRQAQHQADRPLGRLGRVPQAVGRRHRRHPGFGTQLPTDR